MNNNAITFYGTGAAEGIPNPFCECLLCNNARQHGGKDVRTRSMLRIGDSTTIDMSADSFVQANRFGDFVGLEHTLVTHTHEDHFCYMMISVKKMATHSNNKPLNIYFTDAAYDMVEVMRNTNAMMKGGVGQLEERGIVKFHKLEFGKSSTVGELEVAPLRGNHKGNMGEHSANYLITLPGGKKLYYGVDSGPYFPETYQMLRSSRLDYMISECTYGSGEDTAPPPHGHLGYSTCMEVLGNLYSQQTIDKDTQVYLTHINHCHTSPHSDLCDKFHEAGTPYPITVAYDGLSFRYR